MVVSLQANMLESLDGVPITNTPRKHYITFGVCYDSIPSILFLSRLKTTSWYIHTYQQVNQ